MKMAEIIGINSPFMEDILKMIDSQTAWFGLLAMDRL